MKNQPTILDQIGNTPLVELTKMVDNKNVRVFVKLEGNNPGGSVKDRAAYNMIKTAVEQGELKSGDTIVEATSGNTGIALAMIAGAFGLNCILVMPENATPERVKTMKAYGAEVVLTSIEKGIEGSRDIALGLKESHGYTMLNQFGNQNNWKAHYKTTGPEIWRDTEGQITHFVSAMGTTGTIMGVSTFLKEKNQTIQIVGAQPKAGSKIPGIRKWSPDYVPSIFNRNKVDQIAEVSQEEAIATTRALAKQEGIFAGMSSGGAVFSALKLAKTLDSGIIVTVICDRGDRYLSSPLFE